MILKINILTFIRHSFYFKILIWGIFLFSVLSNLISFYNPSKVIFKQIWLSITVVDLLTYLVVLCKLCKFCIFFNFGRQGIQLKLITILILILILFYYAMLSLTLTILHLLTLTLRLTVRLTNYQLTISLSLFVCYPFCYVAHWWIGRLLYSLQLTSYHLALWGLW